MDPYLISTTWKSREYIRYAIKRPIYIYYFLKLFIFIGGYLVYNIVVVFAIHSHESAMGVHVSPILNPPSRLPPHPIPQGHPSAPALSALSHALNLDWRSVSHMVIYLFQCCSLKSSHPRHLPQSPKVCSLHLCLCCCLAYRVIITIFLNSIYMCYYTLVKFCSCKQQTPLQSV